MQEFKDILKKWSSELLIPKKNDVLVNAAESLRSIEIGEYNSSFVLDDNSQTKRLVNDAKKEQRQNGNETLGIARFVIRFHINTKSYCCPIHITPCSVEYSKWEKKYNFFCDEERTFLNPVLSKLFDLEGLNSHEEILETLQNQKLQFEIDELNLVANFHPHRFILLKEIELIGEGEESQNLLSFLGLGENSKEEISLVAQNLVLANEEQNEVAQHLQSENVVIQGPPGTGKSQVILNLIGKALASNQTIALVSEKMAALQVIQKKLGEINLAHFSQNLLSGNAKDYISSLKTTWKYIEDNDFASPNNQLISDLMLNQFDLKIERLKQPALIGSLDFSNFLKKKPSELSNATLLLNPIEIPIWEEQKERLNELQATGFDLFGSWNSILPKHFESADSLERFIEKSKEISISLKQNDAFEWDMEQLELEMKKSALCSLFFLNDQEISSELADATHSKHKKFLKLSRQFNKLEDEIAFLETEKDNWNKNLNLSEIQSFTNTLLEEDKWGIKKFSVKRKIKKLAKAPIDAAVKSLENLKRLKEVEAKLIECKDSLRKLNVEPSKTEIERLQFVLNQIQNSDKSIFAEINKLTKKEKFALKNSSSDLAQLYRFYSTHFRNTSNKTLKQKYESINGITELVTKHFSFISSISNNTIELLATHSSIDAIEKSLYYSHFTKFQGLFPELANYTGTDLCAEINAITAQQKIEFENFVATIAFGIKKRFEEFERLLQTPANKLKSKEKELKKKLRKGKAILVKEFGKSKQLWTPLQLMNSEAEIWINALQPVVIATTYQLAENFPMHQNLFDFVLIDEASQMVSSHAAGSIYRARRIAIAGDQEQMSPSFLFQSENDSSDALHQAQYNWKNIELKHHYRSNHSALINFSNKYFYNNELIVFPSAQKTDSVINIVDTNGVYQNRENVEEAKSVAQWIETKLAAKNKNFGVAAFSESQLHCILNNISEEFRSELDELIDEGLLFKSIENIQGDECDDLIISLGYAKNEEGKFLLQMGPLNKQNGHRRLNVLASRARSSITLVKSISSVDIPLSENDGVNMLRKMLSYFENTSANTKVAMPYHLDFNLNDEKLSLTHPHLKIESGRELYSVISTLKMKGWSVEVEL